MWDLIDMFWCFTNNFLARDDVLPNMKPLILDNEMIVLKKSSIRKRGLCPTSHKSADSVY